MRIVVFSDVHANLVALETVLEHASPADAYWCLGDLVGYGPDPGPVVALVRSLPNLICLQGNHDAAVAGQLPLSWFNEEARQVLEWTQSVLPPALLSFLRQRPPRLDLETVTLVHASLRAPLEEYVVTPTSASTNLYLLDRPRAFIGHSHIPLAWVEHEVHGAVLHRPMRYGEPWPLPKAKALINPGSVGQPRDGDPRAAYAVYDPDENTWTWYRVPYDVQAAQARFHAIPFLPKRFAARLAQGR